MDNEFKDGINPPKNKPSFFNDGVKIPTQQPNFSMPVDSSKSLVPYDPNKGLGEIKGIKAASGIEPSLKSMGKTAFDKIGGIGAVARAAPVLTEGYSAYNDIKGDTLDTSQKAARVGEAGVRAAGAIAGGEVGATLGAVGGLPGSLVGGAIGGIAGAVAPTYANKAYNYITGSNDKLPSEIAAEKRGYGLENKQTAPAAEPINAGLNKSEGSRTYNDGKEMRIGLDGAGYYTAPIQNEMYKKSNGYNVWSSGHQDDAPAPETQNIPSIAGGAIGAATKSGAHEKLSNDLKSVQQNKNGEYVVDYGGGNYVATKDQAKAQQMQDKFNSSGKNANTYGDNLQTVEAGGISALSPTTGGANASLYQDITNKDGQVIGRLSNTPLQAAISARDKAVADNKFNPPEGLTRTGNSTGTIATSSFGGNDGNIQRLNDSVDQQVTKAEAERIKANNEKLPLAERAEKQAAEKDPMGFLKLKQEGQNQKTGFENAYAETKAKALNGDPEAIKNLSQFNSALNPRDPKEPKEEKPAFSDETIAMYPEYAAALRSTPASAMKKLRADYANAIGDPKSMDKVLSNASIESRFPKDMLQQLLQS